MSLHHARGINLSLLLLLTAAGAMAEDAAVEATPQATPAPSTPRAATKSSIVTSPAGSFLSSLKDEEKWVFEPAVGRIDVFYDLEAKLRIQQKFSDQPTLPDNTAGGTKADPKQDLLAYAAAEIKRLEQLLAQRKYDDAVKAGDVALKNLERLGDDPEIQKYAVTIKAYRDQADDALTRDEAQANFDSLKLKIDGILWSESGTRLALIAGEPRAFALNDRVKDCVIVAIDTDRVDFRYFHKRKRFEFPRYIGEEHKDVAAAAPTASADSALPVKPNANQP